MTLIKNPQEIHTMKEGGKIFVAIFKKLEKFIKAGVSGETIENKAYELIKQYNVKPAFLNYKNFPSVICLSLNETIVHDTPAGKMLKSGDLVKLDFGIIYKGFYLDGANTYLINKASSPQNKTAANLLEAAKTAFNNTLAILKHNTPIFKIGKTIEITCAQFNVYPVKELVGHGIGRKLHEDPQIPCYEPKIKYGNFILKAGMTIALEIMLSARESRLVYSKNSIGIMTENKSNTVHLEESIAITENGYDRLTPIILNNIKHDKI